MPKRKTAGHKEIQTRKRRAAGKKTTAAPRRKATGAKAAISRTRRAAVKKPAVAHAPNQREEVVPVPPTPRTPGIEEGSSKPGPRELIEGVRIPSEPPS